MNGIDLSIFLLRKKERVKMKELRISNKFRKLPILRISAWSSLIVAVIYTIVAGTYLRYEYHLLYRDIESVAHRAMGSGDVVEMHAYMKLLQGNMERHEMTSGHTSLFFKSPQNDLALTYQSIGVIIWQLEQLMTLPVKDSAYQVGMMAQKEALNNLMAPSEGYIWVHYWPLYFLGLFFWIWLLVHFFRFDFDKYKF
jgi:hypothetical protein